MMQNSKPASRNGRFAWLCIVTGFAAGFLPVYSWQSGQATSPRAARGGEKDPASSVSGPVIPGRKTAAPETDRARSEPGALAAADGLLFQSGEVEKQLKGPLGRLEKHLQQCELKAVKTQQVGKPDGDSMVRVEVSPFPAAEVEKFWNLAEQELLKLAPGLQPYFMARVQNMQTLYFSHPEQSGVLFVKQAGIKVPGESSVQYWFFQDSEPGRYVLHPDGAIGMPAQEVLPPATPWFAPGTFKQPPRLKHLVSFKYN